MDIQAKKEEYVAKFVDKIVQYLKSNYSMSELEAHEILNDSAFWELVEVDMALVMHYAPSYWARKLYKEQKEYALN